ncbi:MAG: hypothetical protein ACRCSG_09410, partial [Cellulosilyticaceae bacterium]
MEQKQSALFVAISYSYINFIDDYLAVLKNPAYLSCQYLDQDLTDILQEIKTLFVSLPSLLNADTSYKETYAKKIVDFRTVLEKKYRTLHAIQRELQHRTSLYNQTTVLEEANYEDFGMDAKDAAEMDFSALAKDCTDYVFSSSDALTRQQKAAALLTYIPMRMTQERFMHSIEQSLFEINIDDTDEQASFLVDILSQQFDGRNFSGFNSEFDDLGLSLDELQCSLDQESFFEHAELLNETLDYTMSLLQKLHHMICAFGNLLIFDALTFETLTDMHASFYDFFCSLQNIITQHDDSEMFLEILP